MKAPDPKANRPSAALVLRIAKEEASAARANLSDVLAMRKGGAASLGRRRAWSRILRETECSIAGLAHVWGCDRQAIAKALVPFAGFAPDLCSPTYDPSTLQRLASCHGSDRAAEIAAGNDHSTNIDLAKWRGLGARS